MNMRYMLPTVSDARENGLYYEHAYDLEFTSVYASKSTALVLENATHRAAPLVIEGYYNIKEKRISSDSYPIMVCIMHTLPTPLKQYNGSR